MTPPGLDNPRHVAVSPWGDVYVAESAAAAIKDTATSCFDSAEGFACTGATAVVTRISTHRCTPQKRTYRPGLLCAGYR